ncbi:Nucleolar Pre-Ribosomal-Associated Protein 1 [Manis pentadactyla]|nr:Nucleolar Pre-Ribosomal-Associated Protein 1 [Manis pentadactyla]
MSSACLERADRLTRAHLLEGDEDVYAFAQLGIVIHSLRKNSRPVVLSIVSSEINGRFEELGIWRRTRNSQLLSLEDLSGTQDLDRVPKIPMALVVPKTV